MPGPSGHSQSGTCGNPLGERGLNPEGETGIGSKSIAAEPDGDSQGKGGLNPKEATKEGRQSETPRSAESALLKPWLALGEAEGSRGAHSGLGKGVRELTE